MFLKSPVLRVKSGIFFTGKVKRSGETFREPAFRRNTGFFRKIYTDKVKTLHVPQEIEGAGIDKVYA
jgi:hypothetical protein